MSQRLRAWWGFVRSLLIYRRPGRQRGLRRLYAPFVRPGSLVFDLGAHVGDRSLAFAALGARVVAVEPQPRFARWLSRSLAGRDAVVEACGVGAEPGYATLMISRSNPTVSTMNRTWMESAGSLNAGFSDVRWDAERSIEITTLDALIERHGRPEFCKIDVEGVEDRVLAGLSQPLPALSVEFVGGVLDVAIRCVDRLERLGRFEFNAISGEGRTFLWPNWCSAGEIRAWLKDGADGIGSGDLYARFLDGAD